MFKSQLYFKIQNSLNKPKIRKKSSVSSSNLFLPIKTGENTLNSTNIGSAQNTNRSNFKTSIISINGHDLSQNITNELNNISISNKDSVK